jgi:S-adenosylmethionine uptake transporter
MSISRSNLTGAALSLAAFGVYATHDVVVKFLGSSYNAVQIIFFSGLLSFPLVTAMLLSDKRDENLVPRHPWWSLIRAVSAVLTGVAGFFAFSRLPMAQAYAIFFAMPLLITLMAIPMLGERVGLRRGLAVIVGLMGVLVVLRPGEADLGLGHLAALSAAVTGALTSVIVRKIGGNERSAVLMLYPMLGNVLAMGAVLPFVYVPMPIAHLGLMCIIALFGFIGGILVIKAYRTAPAVIVAPKASAAPLAKGVRDRDTLQTVMRGLPRAFLQSDMRAHMNARRMEIIAALATRLAVRLSAPCPRCAAPGWGLLRSDPGLPCSDCGTSTGLTAQDIHGCTACRHEIAQPRTGTADPAYCPICNP